jgi:hypothetical protein
VILDCSVNIGEVALVSTAFPWAVCAMALMAAAGALLAWLARRGFAQASGDAQVALLNEP